MAAAAADVPDGMSKPSVLIVGGLGKQIILSRHGSPMSFNS